VKISAIYTQRIFLWINWWKNFENRFIFAKLIIKHQWGTNNWETVYKKTQQRSITLWHHSWWKSESPTIQ